jgi:chemotaxis family two-component system sensor kinase Cph1
MKLQPGDHICSLYESEDQLVATVTAFLADGLARKERCWYVPSGNETGAVRAAMEQRGIDVGAESRRSALHLLESNDTYIRDGFDPEETMRLFSDAIEEALNDGFNGFRAAADMSWALTVANGTESLIAYEALLRMLFATSPATGLCLYDRRRMPLQVVHGALLTHPIVEVAGAFSRNSLYDSTVATLSDVDPSSAAVKRRQLRSARDRKGG